MASANLPLVVLPWRDRSVAWAVMQVVTRRRADSRSSSIETEPDELDNEGRQLWVASELLPHLEALRK
jgi:hypothetical protein